MAPKAQQTARPMRSKSAATQPDSTEPGPAETATVKPTRRTGRTLSPGTQQSDSEPNVEPRLNTTRAESLNIIKRNWAVQHITDLFSDDDAKTTLGNGNDDFFERKTLTLLRHISEVTKGEETDIQKHLEPRWKMRCGGRTRDTRKIQRRRGADDKKKNRNVRNDMRLYLRRETDPDGLGAHWENESGDDEDDIKRFWNLKALADTMPEHSVPPTKANKPNFWPQELLQLVRALAVITIGRQKEVKKELSKAFRAEHTFEIARALELITSIYDRFDKERRPDGISTMEESWQDPSWSNFPSHAYPGSTVDLSKWPAKLFQAVFELSEDSRGQYAAVIESLNKAFASTTQYSLSGSLRKIKNVHGSFVGDADEPDTSDDEEDQNAEARQDQTQKQAATGTNDEVEVPEIPEDDQQNGASPTGPEQDPRKVTPGLSTSNIQLTHDIVQYKAQAHLCPDVIPPPCKVPQGPSQPAQRREETLLRQSLRDPSNRQRDARSSS
jgi:hypothetical protein